MSILNFVVLLLPNYKCVLTDQVAKPNQNKTGQSYAQLDLEDGDEQIPREVRRTEAATVDYSRLASAKPVLHPPTSGEPDDDNNVYKYNLTVTTLSMACSPYYIIYSRIYPCSCFTLI